MAEIHIQKKKKPVWPWILGAIVMAAIVIWAITGTDNDNRQDQTIANQPVQEQQTETYTDQQDQQRVDAVDDFVTFVQEGNAREEMDIDHKYTSEGIRLLAVALSDMADQLGADDLNIQQKKDELKLKADRIQKDPNSTQHADTIRSAFKISAELMDEIQKENFPNLENQVSNVKETAENVDPNTQTLNQKENVKAFFSSSAQALSEMNNNNNNNTNNNTTRSQQSN